MICWIGPGRTFWKAINMRVLVTRPLEDASELVTALADIGVDALVEPLLKIKLLDAPGPELDGVQALLVTSANGARAFARLSPARDIDVYTVGDASARAARDLGFSSVESASGNVDSLAALVRERLTPENGALLHIAGSCIAGDIGGQLTADGFDYRRCVLYGAEKASELTMDTRQIIQSGGLDGVVLYSPRTASSLVSLLHAAELVAPCQRLKAFCLSPAVADSISGINWQAIVVAASPDQVALIETIRAHA